MITKDTIKNLSNLARMEVSEEEADKLTVEMDSILGYVGQIKDAVGDVKKTVPNHHNIMRDDVSTNEPGEYTEALLKNAPAREGGYVKVKKIL